jgi:hypothetical protein
LFSFLFLYKVERQNHQIVHCNHYIVDCQRMPPTVH